MNNKQHAFTWHVDDVKASYIDPKMNDKFAERCEKKYGSFGSVIVKHVKVHAYLGMKLD